MTGDVLNVSVNVKHFLNDPGTLRDLIHSLRRCGSNLLVRAVGTSICGCHDAKRGIHGAAERCERSPTVKSLEWASALWPHVSVSRCAPGSARAEWLKAGNQRSVLGRFEVTISCTTPFNPSKLTGSAKGTTAFCGGHRSQSLLHIFSCSLCSAVKILYQALFLIKSLKSPRTPVSSCGPALSSHSHLRRSA